MKQATRDSVPARVLGCIRLPAVSAFAIVLLCVGAAVAYGLIHDQVTARICIEYFTIGHPRIFTSDSPTLHALYWGVAATWWAGLAAGVLIGVAARAGAWPKVGVRQVWPMVALLLLVMGFGAWLGGSLGGSMARAYPPKRPVEIRGRVLPRGTYAPFMVCAWAHAASYGVGFAGSVVVAGVVISLRWRWSRRVGVVPHGL
ncbi:MAG: hypothetical protein U0637_00495 [Phycisphaerales bacterium]